VIASRSQVVSGRKSSFSARGSSPNRTITEAVGGIDIGFHVLPGRLRAEAFLGSGGWTITMRDPETPEWVLDYRVLDLPTSLAFVAVRVVRRHFDPDELSEHSPAYTLTGPRDMVTHQEQLIGVFPAPPHAVV
jgi:hypothetical protein